MNEEEKELQQEKSVMPDEVENAEVTAENIQTSDVEMVEGKGLTEDTEVIEEKENEEAEVSDDNDAADQQAEDDESLDEEESEEEDKLDSKPDHLIPIMFGVMAVIAAILAGCLIYSGSMNTKLISAAEVLRKDNQTLQEELSAQLNPETEVTTEPTDVAEPADAADPTETTAPDMTITSETAPVEEGEPAPEAPAADPTSNVDVVEQNVQNQDGATSAEGDAAAEDGEKVINGAAEVPEFATYEGTVNNKKFSFQYPSSWDGHVVFASVENADKSIVITCYQVGQYSDYQNGIAPGTGEIFHILINQSADYRASNNKQYLMSGKDGYYAYYEEPQGITYDYINHADYANDYKLVYDSQQKVWRSFSFL